MGNIIAALLVGGFATIALMLPHGVLFAVLIAPLGASLLAIVAGIGNWLFNHPRLSSKRPKKKQLSEFDRQRN